MKVRGALLERAMMTATAHCAGEGAFLPAWQRYEGVVWKHLDPATLAAPMRQRILVPSGLYGITTATDEIEDYRLTMNVALAPLGTVATFWRPFITEVIRSTRGPIVSFLPNEHLASIDLENEPLRRRITHVAFVQPGSAKAVGHDAKAVKGVLARAVLEGGIAALEGFTWAGWTSSFVDGAWRVVAPRTRQLGK